MNILRRWFLLGSIALVSLGSNVGMSDELIAAFDESEVGLDDRAVVRFEVVTEGKDEIEGPEFEAPDFFIVNRAQSMSTQSYWINGRSGMKLIQSLQVVLKPKKEGKLRISRIRAKIGSTQLTHPDLILTVSGSGGAAAAGSLRNSGGGLRGQEDGAQRGKRYFLKTEVDKSKVIRGEQFLIKYYLYSRVDVSQPLISKYPTFDGLIREEVDVPAGRQTFGAVDVKVVDGVAYRRFELATFLVYGVKEGKIRIDPLKLQFNYLDQNNLFDQDDPFAQLFGSSYQRTEATSDSVSVEVLPLPVEGRPSDYSGAVGQYEIALDANTLNVRENESVTVRVTVKGTGALVTVGEIKPAFPKGFELFESRSSKNEAPAPGMKASKVFETVAIPRIKGEFEIPPVSLSFYNPISKSYETARSGSLRLSVTEGVGSKKMEGLKAETPLQSSTGEQSPIAISMTKLDQGFVLKKIFEVLVAMIAIGFGIFVFRKGLPWVRAFRKSRVSSRDRPQVRMKRHFTKFQAMLSEGNPNGLDSKAMMAEAEALLRACLEVLTLKTGLSAKGMSLREFEEKLQDEYSVHLGQYLKVKDFLVELQNLPYGFQANAISRDQLREKSLNWEKQIDLIENWRHSP